MKALILAAVAALAFGSAGAFAATAPSAPVVDAHSGGTNSAGCHNDHKTGGYHCH